MQLSEPCLQTLAADTSDACIDVLEEDFLPSYEAAVGGLDIAKLPSYRRTLSARFHPYKRPALKNVDERDRLFNTVFDDEYVPLRVPAARRRSPLVPLRMIEEAEATLSLHSHLERAIEFELRVQRLDSTILDFIEGVRRAHSYD